MTRMPKRRPATLKVKGGASRVLICLAVGTLASGVTWLAHGQVHQNEVLPAMTFDVVVQDYSPTDGTLLRTERVTRAMRSDGSTADIRVRDAGSDKRVETRVIEDIQDLRRAFLVKETGTVTSAPLSENHRKMVQAGPQENCGLKDSAIRSQVDGHLAIRDAQNPREPDQPYTERWVAPKLACIPLSTTWKVGDVVVRTELVENIVLGEPDPLLFVVPEDYEEVSPGEAIRRLMAKTENPAYRGGSGFIESFVEQRYHELRAEGGW